MFQIVPQLTVKDLERSRKFYCENLGFSVMQADPPEAPIFVALEREDAQVFLVSEQSREEVNLKELSANKRGVGVRIYVEVDDAKAVYDSLSRVGVEINRDIAYNEDEDYTEFSFLDPDGYEIGMYS